MPAVRRFEGYPPCPICGDPIDYCLGHPEGPDLDAPEMVPTDPAWDFPASPEEHGAGGGDPDDGYALYCAARNAVWSVRENGRRLGPILLASLALLMGCGGTVQTEPGSAAMGPGSGYQVRPDGMEPPRFGMTRIAPTWSAVIRPGGMATAPPCGRSGSGYSDVAMYDARNGRPLRQRRVRGVGYSFRGPRARAGYVRINQDFFAYGRRVLIAAVWCEGRTR